MPELILDVRGNAIPKDLTTHECWLARHGATAKAWFVSRTGHVSDAAWVPKALVELGEPNGGFERMHPRSLQRVLSPICWASGPGFIFDAKGLR